MSDKALLPRRAALRIMDGVIGDGRLMAELSGPKGPLGKLDGADKARAMRLATEALRGADRADRILGPFLRKRPELTVHNVLRLAVLEMCSHGAAPHGVVNSAVSLMREGRETGHFTGLVNAVLRKVSELDSDAWDKLPPAKMPKWLRKPLLADFGKAAIMGIEAVQDGVPPLDLTPKNGDASALAERVGGIVLPTGSVRLNDAGQVSSLAGYEDGDWWVQDAAAAMPVQVLKPQKGERILDVCAAPGGKTMQMAAAGADVVALDVSKFRMERVAENLTRTGLNAEMVVGDALEHEDGPYDAILLDAPCTATGTIRRHPDLPYAKDGSDFPSLFELQEYMIDRALGLLKPGGRLVYCTCSLIWDEGEIQIEDALKRHPDVKIDKDAVLIDGVDPAWASPEGGLRLRPDYWGDIGGMDGFYMACLQKPA